MAEIVNVGELLLQFLSFFKICFIYIEKKLLKFFSIETSDKFFKVEDFNDKIITCFTLS